jgi:DNA uptake protein ComE-like DNA-binding protein
MIGAMKNVLRAAALAALVTACAKKDATTTDSAAGAAAPPAVTAGPTDSTTATTTPAATTATTSAGAMLDPNTATKEQLAAAPGMNAAAADAIVAGRPFADMVAVDKAIGNKITDKKAAYASVWKPIDLNKASKAEMKLIPGVGDKMAHEFEEYRPWKNTAQFDREIGKYVDKAELARLKQYVSIPQ